MKKVVGLTPLMMLVLFALAAFTVPPKPATLLDTPTPTPAATPTLFQTRTRFLMIPDHDLSFVNNSKETLKYSWVDENGVVADLVTLGPGEKEILENFYFSDVIVVRDSLGNIVKVYIVTNDPKQSVTASQTLVDWARKAAITTFPVLKSLRINSDADRLPEIPLTIDNKSLVDLDLFMLDADGKEQKNPTIEAGKKLNGFSYVTTAWRLRDPWGNIILEFIATDAKQTITITNEVIIASWQAIMTKK